MSQNSLKRNYNMTDGELCMVASHLCNTLTRDLISLSVFGVTAPKIAALKALGDAFEVFTTDSVAMVNIIGATDDRNTNLEALKEGIRNMALRCQVKWGAKSNQEKLLNITGFNDFRIEEVLVVARRVHQQMTLLQPDLVDLGLTQIVLDDFWDLIQLCEDKHNEQLDKIEFRDIMTKDRILKGNELYTEVINYCNIGKRVYAMTDPARYNDYIIYDSYIPGTLTAPENLSVDVGTMVFSWTPVENATSYVLLSAVMGSDEFETIYTGTDNFVMYVPPEAGIRQYKTKARSNSGYGPESAIMLYNHVAILPAPGYISVSVVNATTGEVALNWESIENADFYRLFHSQVALGAPIAGEYTLVGEYPTASYADAFQTNYRHWFHVVAGNSELLSTASDSVMVDMPLVP